VVGTSGGIYSIEWPQAFIWQNGVMNDIGALDRHLLSGASDINNHGQVAVTDYDWAESNTCCEEAFLWEDGVRVSLGSLGGGRSMANGINDDGQVVGYSSTGQAWHAFSWKDGVMIDLGTLGGDYSKATAVNNRGQIIGRSEMPSGEIHLFLWEDGVMTDLGVEGPTARAFINDAGQIAGWEADGTEHGRAFMWEDGVFTDLVSFHVWGFNNCGQVLGFSPGIDGADRQMVLWEDGILTDVASLGRHGAPWDINDAGQIVGIMEVELPDGYTPFHATLWTRDY